MKVMKFGGTSVGTPERMHQVAKLITTDSDPKFVVLSALSGTTNTLVSICHALKSGKQDQAQTIIAELLQKYNAFYPSLVKTPESRQQAAQIIHEHFDFLRTSVEKVFSENLEKEILAQGELLSTQLFAAYLEEEKVSAVLLPALEFMRINEENEPDTDFIKSMLKEKLSAQKVYQIYITQGYICKNSRGGVDNLQRGGSDYSASLIGAAMDAEEIQIWTDIDGMHNNDPRVVDKTFPVAELSFDEAAELAYFGAKILHPSSIRPAQRANIPVRLLNTMQPEAPGTLITEKKGGHEIKAVAAKDGITAIKIKSSRMLLAYGFLCKIFGVFEKYQTPIDMITTSEVAVSLTIDDETHLEAIVAELKAYGDVEIDAGQTIICIVGHMLVNKRGVLKRAMNAVGDLPVRMVSYGGSRYNISLLIDSNLKKEALNLLNKGLFEL